LQTESIGLYSIQIIWLNIDRQDESKVVRETLEQFNTNIKLFYKKHECLSYIQKQNKQNIFLVISDYTDEENTLNSFKTCENLTNIYIYCTDKNRSKSWSKEKKNIHEIFTDYHDLIFKLIHDITYYYGRKGHEYEQLGKHQLALEQYQQVERLYNILAKNLPNSHHIVLK
ncbi:unnamed protein product, partial [Didymodactylos carnosus]